MYDTIADVQEKNDAVIDAQNNNDASCECTIPLWMYKRRTMQLQMYTKRMFKEQVTERSCKAQICSYKGTSGKSVN